MTSQDGVAPITPTLRSSNHRMSWYTAEFKNLNPNIQECSPLLQEPGDTQGVLFWRQEKITPTAEHYLPLMERYSFSGDTNHAINVGHLT